MEKLFKILGFDDYRIDKRGRVYSLKFGKRKELKQNLSRGYPNVMLFRTGKNKLLCKVHRLLAIAFIPNPENKPEVNHKNGVRDDYNLKNLEWVTHQENVKHTWDVLKRQPSLNQRIAVSKAATGVLNSNAKLNPEKVRKIRELRKQGVHYKILCKQFNIVHSSLYAICNRRQWQVVI